MIIDNFDLISQYMSFESPDDFYFVQVLVRGKDGNVKNIDGGPIGGNNKNRLVRFWCIRSVEELMKCKSDIISIAESVNGRAYIHSTKRSFKEVARAFMKTSIETFVSENYEGLKSVYSTACGQSFQTKDKKYLIDIDFDDCQLTYDEIKKYLECCRPVEITSKILYTVPTAHGYHLICIPFDVDGFKELTNNKIIVHKNNPTLLYFNLK